MALQLASACVCSTFYVSRYPLHVRAYACSRVYTRRNRGYVPGGRGHKPCPDLLLLHITRGKRTESKHQGRLFIDESLSFLRWIRCSTKFWTGSMTNRSAARISLSCSNVFFFLFFTFSKSKNVAPWNLSFAKYWLNWSTQAERSWRLLDCRFWEI